MYIDFDVYFTMQLIKISEFFWHLSFLSMIRDSYALLQPILGTAACQLVGKLFLHLRKPS